MRTGFRIVALFAAYTGVGFGGEYAAELVAQELGLGDSAIARHALETTEVRRLHIEPIVDVVVDVNPDVVVDVRVRHGDEHHCRYEETHDMSLSARGVAGLRIDAGSGELRVEGESGRDEVVVEARVCASEERWLQEMRVSVDEGRDGSVALTTHYPDRSGWSDSGTARIDLVVRVPRGLALDVEDSSGDIEISGVGDLRLRDSSGSIDVRGIEGSVDIRDSSGGIEIEDVAGDVAVEDGSGGLDVRRVQGSVLIEDGSGGVDVVDVGRDVVVASDGSGGIDVRGVGGDFVVDRDGSGGIRHSDVEGRVEIPEDRRKRRRGGR